MGQFIDLTGQRFGKLTVIHRVENIGVKTAWLCKCDCGNELVVISNSLRTGNTKSCGCLSKTHGGTRTRLYVVWIDMMARCYKQKTDRYDNYGKRGIKVCDEWHDFSKFREWAIKTGYDPNAKRYECTIDRIDINGNYCPENCRWVTMFEQQQNTTRTHYVTVDGERMNMAQASRKYGVGISTIWWRLNQGIDDETAVKKKKLKRGEAKCLNASLLE